MTGFHPQPRPTPRVLVKAQTKRDQDTADRKVRMAVKKRDKGKCRECGKASMHQHHIVFKSHGGKTSTANVVSLCQFCHQCVHARVLTIQGNANKSLRMEWRTP